MLENMKQRFQGFQSSGGSGHFAAGDLDVDECLWGGGPIDES